MSMIQLTRLLLFLSLHGSALAAFRIAVLGGLGDNSYVQSQVAGTVEAWCAQRQSCDHVVSAAGATGREFNGRWRPAFAGAAVDDATWLMSAGPEHKDKADNLNVASRDAWYATEIEDADTDVLLYAIDTEALLTGEKDLAIQQLEELERALATSDASWKIVYGYHSILSAGNTLRQQLLSLLKKYSVDVYISGQGRGQKHMVQSGDLDIDFIITGARLRSDGAESNDEEETMVSAYKSRFSSTRPGFAGITINKHTLRVQYMSYEGGEEDMVDDTVREEYMYKPGPLKWQPLYTFIRHHNHN